MNIIWIALLSCGVIVAGLRGEIDIVTQAAMTSAKISVESMLELVGVIVLWLGLARIAEKSGLIDIFAGLMKPVLKLLFPSVPANHPAMGSILMNMSANVLGLGGAATPLGLRAMQQLQEINPDKRRASDAMVTFLVLNTAGLTFVPAVMIGLRAQLGSERPAEIVAPTLLATVLATAAGLTFDAFMRWREQRRGRSVG